MATQLKDRPSAKHDPFIEQQLARAERRIRFIDLSAALLGLAAGTLAYGVAVMLLDRGLHLSAGARQLGLLLYLVTAGAFVAFAVVRPLMWKVNRHYAARLLEGTLESDRNHVVNWVDLHGEKVPAVIKTSLGQRAAKDLAGADPEQAVPARRLHAGAAATTLLLAVFVALFFAFGIGQFRSLLSRAFAPFGGTAIPTRTQVSILRPHGGDATVTIGQPVTIAARVEGRVPAANAKDAPCLLYRHDPSEPYRQRYLQADEVGAEWAATVGPTDVGEGFFYKVTAGDDETPEYRVTARAAPLISDFRATFRHRKYVGKADYASERRDLEGLEGTEVILRVRTNRKVGGGKATFEGDGAAPAVAGTTAAEEPQTLRVRFPLSRSCKYRIEFTSSEGERYVDPVPYDIAVAPDNLPQVNITKPAKDVSLPAGGHLELEGEASDDIGVAKVELRLTLDGKPLAPRPYLADKLGKPGFGTPRTVEYRHLLELPALTDAAGKKVALKPGMVIEYRLAAADACDFRVPAQEALSEPAYKITIAEQKDGGNEQKDRDDARKRQEEHDKQQEDRLKEEDRKREEQKKKDEQGGEADPMGGAGGNQPDKKKDAEGDQPQQGDQGGDKKKDDGKGDGKDKDKDAAGQPNTPKGKDDQTQKTADELKKEIENSEKGESKDGGNDKPADPKKGEGGEGMGDGKEDGKPGEQANDGGQDGKGQASEGKDGQKDGKPGDGKQGDGKKPSESKEKPKGDGKPGESKGDGKGPPGKEKGERKPDEGPKEGDNVREGTGKPSDTEGKPADGGKPGQARPQGDAKPGDPKDGKDGDAKKGDDGSKGDRAGNGKSGDPKEKKGEGKADNKRPKPKDAGAEDAKKAADELKNGDAKQRRQAAKDLDEMANKAEDKGARDAAKKAIDQAKKDGELDQEGKPQGKPGDDRKDGKGEPGDDGMGDGKPGEQGEEKEGPGKPGKVKGRQDTPEGGNPGEGGDEGRRNPGEGGGGDDLPAKNQAPRKSRASQFQLDEFKKKVDKDILDKMKMSREQFERFLRDYAELAKRQPKDGSAPERLPEPSRGGGMPGMGGKAIEATGKGKDDLRNDGRPKPPPGYRDAYNEFLKRLNEPRK